MNAPFRKVLTGAAGLAMVLFAQSAAAATLVSLVGGNTLLLVDTATRQVTKAVTVQGASGLVGIDVRPSDGKLYGITSDGTIVTIDPATGAATTKGKLQVMVPVEVMVTVDFNPAADRLRVMGSDGTSLRANVDDGAVTKDGSHKYADADTNKGKSAKIGAGAYTNSYKGTKETILYDVDVPMDVLVKQAPPNDGTLNTVGKLGVNAKGPVAFDIESDGKMGNKGWLIADNTLYSVNLDNGKASRLGKIDGSSEPITDIAVWPKM